jgi:hypothetical protein
LPHPEFVEIQMIGDYQGMTFRKPFFFLLLDSFPLLDELPFCG